jgi:hypothetical protein
MTYECQNCGQPYGLPVEVCGACKSGPVVDMRRGRPNLSRGSGTVHQKSSSATPAPVTFCTVYYHTCPERQP